MGKKYRNLIEKIVAPENMALAYRRTATGKRRSIGYLEFKEYSSLNLASLALVIEAGTYVQGPYRHFTVFEPKPRLISALSFRDRVAQHALVSVIGPIFEAGFLPRSYACRDGFGTHRGVVELQAEMRRMGNPLYVLKTDYSKFFPSVDRAVLHRLIAKKISCHSTLDLIGHIVPPTGKGLPIGSLTSQLFANVYGGEVDRHVHHALGQRAWFRYMDDIVVLGRCPALLRAIKDSIVEFSGQRLGLRLSKWSVQNGDRGVNFLGYRVWPTHKLLRRQSVVRAKEKIKRLRAAGDLDGLQRFLAAWTGHARWGDSHNLLVSLNVRKR